MSSTKDGSKEQELTELLTEVSSCSILEYAGGLHIIVLIEGKRSRTKTQHTQHTNSLSHTHTQHTNTQGHTLNPTHKLTEKKRLRQGKDLTRVPKSLSLTDTPSWVQGQPSLTAGSFTKRISQRYYYLEMDSRW